MLGIMVSDFGIFVILGKMGLLSLVSVIGGKSPLRTLYLQKQTTSSQLTIPDMVEVFTKLAQCLGLFLIVTLFGEELSCIHL